jgi:ribosomal small subunit protein bTHX
MYLLILQQQKLDKYLIIMGKGDKKSRRGKIHIGSHGVRRQRKKGSTSSAPATPKVVIETAQPAKSAPKKVAKEAVVTPAAEVTAEVKKPARKTAKKIKEEPAEE